MLGTFSISVTFTNSDLFRSVLFYSYPYHVIGININAWIGVSLRALFTLKHRQHDSIYTKHWGKRKEGTKRRKKGKTRAERK